MGGNKVAIPSAEQYAAILNKIADIFVYIGECEEHVIAANAALNDASVHKDELMNLLFEVAGKSPDGK
jgi:hypothetical protein